MSERLIPEHDQVLLKQLDDRDEKIGSILIPKAGDYDHLKTDRERNAHTPDRDNTGNQQRRNTNRYEVLAVGPGSYVDVADELHDAVFLRKPMCCKKGDVVIVQEGALPIMVDNEIRHLCHDYLILATVVTDTDGKETIDPKHDYVFFKQAEVVQKTKSGLYMGTTSDQTGNKALPDRYEVLGVGDGPWALRQEKGKIPAFARRPMSVQMGDIFTFEGGGFMVMAAGALMGVCQNYQVAGRFVQETA